MLKTFVIKLALIVISVKSQSVEESSSPTIRNYANLTRIEDILELFSVEVIGSQWKQIYSKLNSNCANDMMEYLSGLEEKEIWAIKSKLFKFLAFYTISCESARASS